VCKFGQIWWTLEVLNTPFSSCVQDVILEKIEDEDEL
jgi:hypothetical protein